MSLAVPAAPALSRVTVARRGRYTAPRTTSISSRGARVYSLVQRTSTRRIPVFTGSPWSATGDWLSGAWKKLTSLQSLHRGWDGYDAPAPSGLAIAEAMNCLVAFHAGDLQPTRLAPSVVGGVGLTVRQQGRKAYVEFYNDGLVYLLLSDGVSEPMTRPVRTEHRGYENLVAAIRTYLNG